MGGAEQGWEVFTLSETAPGVGRQEGGGRGKRGDSREGRRRPEARERTAGGRARGPREGPCCAV